MESIVHFVIYFSPNDFPKKFVIRRWFIKNRKVLPDLNVFTIGDSLREVRKRLPRDLTCIARDISDDPSIVETWI